ncbi:MAG: hypothetical protein RIB60_05085 [Phycisphaerales bacterium]
MGDLLLATATQDAAPQLLRAWTMLLLLVVLGVASVTVLWVLFVIRRHRAGKPRRKRHVTSQLSAWDEAATRVEPWEGPDPADLNSLDDPDGPASPA